MEEKNDSRTESYDYFDHLTERSVEELLTFRIRDSGKLIAGLYCVYAPGELIRAADIIPVGLCGKKETPIQHAEKVLPSSLCPLIKSSYGYAATDTCPFFALSDFIIGETTCDGKKKMYEFLGRLKSLYLIQLPYDQEGKGARAFWKSEMERFCDFLFEKSGTAVTEKQLAHQIRVHNRMRRELKLIWELAADSRSPLNSLQIMTILEGKSFVVDMEEYIGKLRTLRTELEEIISSNSIQPDSAPCRILLTGCPIGKGCEKVLNLVEEAGASVVCMENCTGMKSISTEVKETGDPFQSIADRYLDIPCSCMTPNTKRMDSIRILARDFNVQGVIDMTWQFCHTYNIESEVLEEEVQRDLELPFLHLETDYSPSDTEQLRTRIEAFLEIVSK